MVVLLYTGLLGLMMLALTYNVIRNRLKHKVPLLTGNDNPEMLKAVRIHGNFAEFVPFALLIMGFAEYNGAPGWFIHALGIALVAGRVLHVWGLSGTIGTSPGRLWGSILTHVVYLAGSLACIWLFLVARVFGLG